MARGRHTPSTRETVWAIADTRRCVLELLDAHGLREQATEIIELFDFSQAAAEKADIDRRRSHAIEDIGEIVPKLERDLREWRARYQHVLPLFGAQAA